MENNNISDLIFLQIPIHGLTPSSPAHICEPIAGAGECRRQRRARLEMQGTRWRDLEWESRRHSTTIVGDMDEKWRGTSPENPDEKRYKIERIAGKSRRNRRISASVEVRRRWEWRGPSASWRWDRNGDKSQTIPMRYR